jgi:tRNA pseudouridine38-40 synthase
MPRYKITIAYDGTDFHGWQRQHDKREDSTDRAQSPGGAMSGLSGDETEPRHRRLLRTVQDVLERATREVVREPVSLLGASRTDAGVHARGQVAAFTTTREIPIERLPRAITSRLPRDVMVTRAEIVPEGFDPIRDAIAKGYQYRIMHSCATERRPLFLRNFVTSTAYRLDPARMNEAARLLIGEHDFASFTRVAHGRESTVRTVYQCKVERTSMRRCHIDIVGNGFLYNMVRIIAGTLLEVGRGAIEPEHMPAILAARDRSAAGPTLAPNGLCLMWIRYPQPPSPDACTRVTAPPT